MADRTHHLEFTVEASTWEIAERVAASRIRSYTREARRGPDASPDEDVLRDAEFWAVDRGKHDLDRMWVVTVRVTV